MHMDNVKLFPAPSSPHLLACKSLQMMMQNVSPSLKRREGQLTNCQNGAVLKSNMNQDSVAALPISCFKCFQKQISICCQAAMFIRNFVTSSTFCACLIFKTKHLTHQQESLLVQCGAVKSGCWRLSCFHAPFVQKGILQPFPLSWILKFLNLNFSELTFGWEFPLVGTGFKFCSGSPFFDSMFQALCIRHTHFMHNITRKKSHQLFYLFQ